MSLRVVFMGTPDFSVPTLMEIVGQGHEVVACYCTAAAAGRAGHGPEEVAGARGGGIVRHSGVHAHRA
jgi:methionyl-tRNA formyltransferase